MLNMYAIGAFLLVFCTLTSHLVYSDYKGYPTKEAYEDNLRSFYIYPGDECRNDYQCSDTQCCVQNAVRDPDGLLIGVDNQTVSYRAVCHHLGEVGDQCRGNSSMKTTYFPHYPFCPCREDLMCQKYLPGLKFKYYNQPDLHLGFIYGDFCVLPEDFVPDDPYFTPRYY